jgi:hypothetical protein
MRCKIPDLKRHDARTTRLAAARKKPLARSALRLKEMRKARRLLALVLGIFAFLLLNARPAQAEPGAALTVSLLTMGPGEHPFTKFGHSAIWIHDARTNRDEVFNFGTFAFDSKALVLDSIEGKLPYWLSVQSMSSTLASYGEQHRSLLASELRLTPAERLALLDALRDNARPEHRYYRYDYYRDNCATRVRDALDRALGGRIHAHGTAPARMSYRQHTLRLVADDAPLYVALDLAVGRRADTPITFWDEGFLPERLHDLIAHTTVSDGARELPLVKRERWLLSAGIVPTRSAPPRWFWFYLGVGLGLGSALALLGAEADSARARLALGVTSMTFGVPLGLLGSALTYLTFFSAHSAAASNYNVLLLPPWILVLPLAAIATRFERAWAMPLARVTASATLSTTLLALALHLLQHDAQQNGQALAFALPLWCGATSAAFRRKRPSATRHA